jgi:hypothetical protein
MAAQDTPNTFSPRISLRQIIIDLPPHSAPVVTLRGATVSADRRADRAATEASIQTLHLPPAGHAFIAEMLAAFMPASDKQPAKPRLRVTAGE